MHLRQKAVLGFNLMLLIACLLVGFISYRNANEGFDTALGMKARHDLDQVMAILDARFPGPWAIKDGAIFKGSEKIEGNMKLMDELGPICGNNITVFNGDTRVATTFKDDSGKRPVGTKASAEIIEKVLKGGQTFTGHANVLGNNYLCGYKPIKDGSGKNIGMLFMGIPTADIEGVQKSFITGNVIAIIILLVIIGAIAWVVIGRTISPLEIVAHALDGISHGDLTGNELHVHTTDEIGQMSDCCNNVLMQLKALMGDVSDSAQQVAASSQELTASATEAARTVQHVADNTIKVAEGLNEQNTHLDDVAAQTENMNTQMAALYEVAQAMKQAANESQQGAEKGRVAVDEANRSMGTMAGQMEEASKVVSTLGDRSKEIGQIVDAISNIAGQTNLLALNAAIEAARAGEAGRGFAVVAEEVRKLAEQSGEAAQNIASLIGGIQHDTEEAVTAMQRSNESVQTSSQVVNQAGTAFAHIVEQVNNLNEHIQSSLDKINQTNQSSQEVLRAVKRIQEVGASMSNDAQTVSAATEEQASVMHEMSEASHSLADMAQLLQNNLAKFKL
ncbi:MAG: methyl-accepting chemotaxis protein [Schwartzia sp.]|nr:methyl-accepting chemotaxis protein [Schwartzia sp. (in: firmicutes)]